MYRFCEMSLLYFLLQPESRLFSPVRASSICCKARPTILRLVEVLAEGPRKVQSRMLGVSQGPQSFQMRHAFAVPTNLLPKANQSANLVVVPVWPILMATSMLFRLYLLVNEVTNYLNGAYSIEPSQTIRLVINLVPGLGDESRTAFPGRLTHILRVVCGR